LNTSYINTLWEDGYTPEEVIKVVKESHAAWQEKQKDNKKIEEARTALAVAAANFAEALGVEVPQEAIDRTIDMLKNLETGKVKVQVSTDSDADKRLKKFLRGIL
jgi:hypothetical protein